ncbi:uncharacterized protein LOC127841184 [Dreissena polymorpha]|uniref:Uncharacterized protein n=1 Tax=Dreissena polymorpha TaxID=45954 RepID=A0A9D4INS7_DREPO|nr:uncharacterized protein LOC127841184 [Dreissena polymorpha]KAH3781205.1 hypothetical protein DPMN_159031 [Dreissena polymorpha]
MSDGEGGEWMRLDNMVCPVRDCTDRTPGPWVCGKDGNGTFLNEYGKIKCATKKDAKAIHIGDLCNWNWKCGNNHAGQSDKADYGKFTFAMSDALRYGGESSSQWLVTLIKSLGRQYNK